MRSSWKPTANFTTWMPDPDAEIGFMPARILAGEIAAKRISPVEATAAILRRVEALEPRLNALSDRSAETAMQDARAAEAAIMSGAALGPLHGLTVTIKDLMPVAGMRMERGSKIHSGERPPQDATTVRRLKAAGAIVIGKTTTSEFGWSAVSKCPAVGWTHNPWKHGYNAGASSAGAAVAAAVGYGALHQGSDGAGSVRLPAHFCGVVGLKPSFGRIPYTPTGNNDYMSHIGPITRSVDDAALMLQVMAGPDPIDHTTQEGRPDCSPETLRRGVAGLRVAYSPDLGHARVDPDVAELVAAAAHTFQQLGAKVEQVTPPWGKLGPDLIEFFWPAHMSVHAHRLADWADQMDPNLVACIREADGLTVQDYMAMRARKLAYAASIGEWFQDWDLLLTPSASVAAFPLDGILPPHWPQHPWNWIAWAEFSYPFNMSHNPAISVPCGFTAAGLPVGLQIVGRRLDDTTVLTAATAFETARPWSIHRPNE